MIQRGVTAFSNAMNVARMPGRLSARTRCTPRGLATLAGLGMLLGTLPGCQSITGSPSAAQIRLIDSSPDAGGLDVYQGTGILAYNLGLGTITSYVSTTPGNYAITADAAGTKQQLASQSGTFSLGNQYTVLIGDFSTGLQETILLDQAKAAPSGQVSLRFLDQTSRSGAVDLYLIPSGSTIVTVKPLLTNVTFGQNTGYLNVPSGMYTLAAVPTGTVPTATGTTFYTGAAVTYPSGSARTIVLLDQQLITMPGLQVITANDYDSPGATQ